MPYKDRKSRTCGFIDIEEKEKSAKFVRRYLRLDRSAGLLEWYADNPSNMPPDAVSCGSVDVNYITKVDIPAKVKFKAKHCFVVNTPMRRYFLQANDEPDMKEWVETLNNASKIVVSDDDNEPEENGSQKTIQSDDVQEDFSYKTEIVAGVIVQKKVYVTEENAETRQKENASRSSSLVPSPSAQSNSKLSISSESPEIFRKGYAVKQGHVRKNWKRRYFILDEIGLSYFKSDQDKEPIRHIPLTMILAAKVDDRSSSSEHKDNLFLVVTTDRVYFIQADTPEDMNGWVGSFNAAVKSGRHLKHRSKGSEPGDHDTNDDVPRRRKLESTLSLVSPDQRKSVQVFAGKGTLEYEKSAPYSPITNYRLSTAEAIRKQKGKKKSGLRFSQGRSFGSSSEDSAGFSSSVESLVTGVSEIKASGQPVSKPDKSREVRKVYKRSCSGSDLVVPETRTDSTIPAGSWNAEEEARHSFPSSRNVSVQVKPENLLPSHVSFSHTNKAANTRPPLSSLSFSAASAPAGSHPRPSRSFLLDPQVDLRAAVKPSTVKKKRNTGILFSLNNMLNKKAEKMSKSVSKKRN